MKTIFFIVTLLIFTNQAKSQERPFIWVKNDERAAILEKIETQDWAAKYYQAYVERLNEDFTQYQKNPHSFLRGILLDIENAEPAVSPPLQKVYYHTGKGKSAAKVHMRYLQVGIDCGVMYYLTQDEKYAQCALDILYAYIVGYSQFEPETASRNDGWLYGDGQHLREAREIGAQVPMIYDFVSQYIQKGAKPYDMAKKANVDFPHELAQEVFRTYVDLAINRGHTGSNWSVLEAPSFVHNLLCLEDLDERHKYLEIFLNTGSEWQDPLSVVAANYQQEGDVYPETSQYSNGVASLTTHLLTVVTKYKPELHLGQKYVNVPMALSRWEDMKFPNGELVRFGDGHRYGGASYESCDAAYYFGKLDNVPELVKKNGTLVKTAIKQGKYDRSKLGSRSYGAHPYFDPIPLLWYCAEVEGDIEITVEPRTDFMRHAALYLQRNKSKTPEDGLMCFVGGASMVHGNANGMNMELYGQGQVLGAEQGRVGYGKEMHENYSRLYAAHNTIIVNGNSRSDGDWANLGINSVQLISMEPMPKEEAISPNYSYTLTSFVDDKGDLTEAYQERTMAIVRTSASTGYYVDVFRSNSKLPNEYHDYLYHNIGDKVELLNDDIELKPTPERYMANANLPWERNRAYRHPGWHYFENVQTSQEFDGDVLARFSIEKLKGKALFMNMHILGDKGREYTKVSAPYTYEAPKPYNKMPTPTLLIRKTGEAWDEPFVVIYEPFAGSKENSSVKSVEKLEQEGVYKGLKVISNTPNKKLLQYIISQSKGETFKDKNLGIEFTGSFAIITLDEEGELQDMYIGKGEQLIYKDTVLESTNENCAYQTF